MSLDPALNETLRRIQVIYWALNTYFKISVGWIKSSIHECMNCFSFCYLLLKDYNSGVSVQKLQTAEWVLFAFNRFLMRWFMSRLISFFFTLPCSSQLKTQSLLRKNLIRSKWTSKNLPAQGSFERTQIKKKNNLYLYM